MATLQTLLVHLIAFCLVPYHLDIPFLGLYYWLAGQDDTEQDSWEWQEEELDLGSEHSGGTSITPPRLASWVGYGCDSDSSSVRRQEFLRSPDSAGDADAGAERTVYHTEATSKTFSSRLYGLITAIFSIFTPRIIPDSGCSVKSDDNDTLSHLPFPLSGFSGNGQDNDPAQTFPDIPYPEHQSRQPIPTSPITTATLTPDTLDRLTDTLPLPPDVLHVRTLLPLLHDLCAALAPSLDNRTALIRQAICYIQTVQHSPTQRDICMRRLEEAKERSERHRRDPVSLYENITREMRRDTRMRGEEAGRWMGCDALMSSLKSLIDKGDGDGDEEAWEDAVEDQEDEGAFEYDEGWDAGRTRLVYLQQHIP